MSYTEPAQKFIHSVVTAKRAGDISKGIDQGLNALVNELNVDRAMVWQVCGDRLSVTNEASLSGSKLNQSKFDSQESTHIVLSFLSRSPGGKPVVAWSLERNCGEIGWKPYLERFSEMSSHLVGEFRCDIFSGFFALQSAEAREWAAEDKKTVEGIAEFLSVLFVMNHEMQKAQSAAKGNA
jgi:hypothetical protein